MKLLTTLAFFSLLATGTFGQKNEVTVEPFFSGLAPTAIKLPLPTIKPNISVLPGIISVAITVDESGNVVITDDGEGPYPFCKNVTDPVVLEMRSLAVSAARKARFSPAILDGQTRAVSGRLNYDFRGGESPKIAAFRIGGTDETSGSNSSKAESSGANIVGPDGKPVPASNGVLNGKAVSLGKPIFPAAAKAVRAGGAVSVEVVIQEDGSIYTSRSISGHPLLRRASEIAACSSKFMPTLLQGNPVKVAGIITYNFVP